MIEINTRLKLEDKENNPSDDQVKTPKIESIEANKNDTGMALFDIKKLNDINDKMIRGSLKKIYMGGKRSSKNSNEVIDEMLKFLNDEGKGSEEILNLINSLKSENVDISNTSSSNESDSHEESKDQLFDIKKLNDIEDKVIRGTLKKIYMAGKRGNLSSEQVVDNMIKDLTDLGKIDENLSEFLRGLK